MYFRIIRNDFSKSKFITVTTTLFVAIAAMLVSLAVILTVNLSSSLDSLITKAKTPHFMQMHSGEIDIGRLTYFAEQNSDVEQFQVVEFLNIEGAKIIIGNKSLKDSVQDNGFSIQSDKFDYLLDLEGNKINVADGELFVPISYMRDNAIKIGDKAAISGKEFTVVGFLRDSQMNSTLSSSKRFLISKNDYEAIKPTGSLEYLIEFRLKDLAALGSFETAYASAGLEANGPTVTYSLFKMMNALSDGLMIAVILLISALVITIALLCIRFTLLAKIEDDYREIGVMKAIGIRVSDIKKIYLAKYVMIAVGGSILGFVLSLLFKGLLQENIRLYMGAPENSFIPILLGIIGILVIIMLFIVYVSVVLKRFRKISAVEAMRFGTSQDNNKSAKRFVLNKNKLFHTNVFLGINDVITKKRLYSTMLVVLILAAFIMIVPYNLYTTISSKSFTEYMGIGDYDMRIDIQGDNIPNKTQKVVKVIDEDQTISQSAVLTTKLFKMKMEDGTEENIKIELGNHTTFPIKYSKGRAPEVENEIALSILNAGEMNKKVGDVLTLVIEGKEKDFIVSGIYSDITNGGKTAKAIFADNSAGIMWSVICAKFTDQTVVGSKVQEYTNIFHSVKISDVNHFVKQTFGSTIDSIKLASYMAVFIALLIVALVIVLFMKMLVAKDKYSIAIMKTLGFTKLDIKVQYVTRSVLILLVGTIFGTLLANTLGEKLAGKVISSFGAASFDFTIHPFLAYGLFPFIMLCVVLISTIIGTANAGREKISKSIKG